ncbi:MAG: hypothetical protein JW395_3453 [Nitrospira sp.]|nr:hypothetical protein [Nitrospira sp.]
MSPRALVCALSVMVAVPAIAQSPREGSWRVNNAEMTIRKQDNIYLVTITCPGCMGPIAGTFVGPLKGDILMINSFLGVIVYNADGTLSYLGEQWQRKLGASEAPRPCSLLVEEHFEDADDLVGRFTIQFRKKKCQKGEPLLLTWRDFGPNIAWTVKMSNNVRASMCDGGHQTTTERLENRILDATYPAFKITCISQIGGQ